MKGGILKNVWKLLMFGLLLFLLTGFFSSLPETYMPKKSTPDAQLIKLSEDFLLEVKMGKPPESEKKLLEITTDSLLEGLTTDAAKKVFWLNLYNGWFQLLAAREQIKHPDIFTRNLVAFKDRSLSLDEIEHGILRRYRWKYSLGYLPHFFISKRIKELTVESLDNRIHFALNCGAKSCPAIAFYTLEALDKQLNLATENFIIGETTLDHKIKRINTSKILDWFRGDFGGANGIKVLIGNQLNLNLNDYSVHFNAYDWTTNLHNFVEK
jgi:hypothetical protein